MKIALIGGGEVGRCYARALSQAGHRIVALCDVKISDALDTLSRELGATLQAQPGPWLHEADVVISAVFGSAAQQTAEQALPHMARTALYADFTTASAQDMAAAAERAAALGIDFADVAIMGAISLGQGKTPLLCAGTGAARIHALMHEAGAPIRQVGGRAGDAVTLKLLRSIFTKGCEALAVECLVAAHAKGLRQELYEVLQDIDQQPLQVFLEMLVRTHVQHAPRRLVEVEEASRQLESDGLEPRVLPGVRSLFARTAAALDKPPQVASVDDALAWLHSLARR